MKYIFAVAIMLSPLALHAQIRPSALRYNATLWDIDTTGATDSSLTAMIEHARAHPMRFLRGKNVMGLPPKYILDHVDQPGSAGVKPVLRRSGLAAALPGAAKIHNGAKYAMAITLTYDGDVHKDLEAASGATLSVGFGQRCSYRMTPVIGGNTGQPCTGILSADRFYEVKWDSGQKTFCLVSK